ncbi:hypothetical protein, partial [Lacticaseibacillus paracasei]
DAWRNSLDHYQEFVIIVALDLKIEVSKPSMLLALLSYIGKLLLLDPILQTWQLLTSLNFAETGWMLLIVISYWCVIAGIVLHIVHRIRKRQLFHQLISGQAQIITKADQTFVMDKHQHHYPLLKHPVRWWQASPDRRWY